MKKYMCLFLLLFDKEDKCEDHTDQIMTLIMIHNVMDEGDLAEVFTVIEDHKVLTEILTPRYLIFPV